MPELSHLRCFVALADELHYGRAAERLNMTQPPLSRQIQLLEHRVGVPLVRRTSRRVALTAAGESFADEARRLLEQMRRATTTAHQVAAGATGVIRLGFTAASSYSALPDLLKLAQSHLPTVALELSEMVTRDQLDGLARGSLDIAVVRPTGALQDHQTVSFPREALVAAVPTSQATGLPNRLSPSDFDGRAVIGYATADAAYFDRLTDRMIIQAGAAPRIVQRVAQVHLMLALVSAGLGWALVPESACAMARPSVTFLPFDTDPPLPVELLAIAASTLSPAAGHLLKLLRHRSEGGSSAAGAS